MAGTVTFAHHLPQSGVGRVIATCTADAADASFPATAIPAIEGSLLALHTNPGATGPTDDYDITLVDADGLDRLQGVGGNRDITTSEGAPIVYSGTANHPPVARGETLTLTLAGNAVNSAVTVITIFYSPVAR